MGQSNKHLFKGYFLFFQLIFWCGASLVLIIFNSFSPLNHALQFTLSIVCFYSNYAWLSPQYQQTKKPLCITLGILIPAVTITIWHFVEGIQIIYVPVSIVLAGLFGWVVPQLSNSRKSTDAELNILKSQFSPHFLFNTLNIIYSKCHVTSPEAAGMIQNLSNFMRYLSNECSKDKVLLQKEVAMIHDYITLYKGNYTDGINIKFLHKLYDPEQKIAPMLLLNFVENAFKHSHIAVKQDAYVTIELATDRDYLHFKVTNNKAAAINQLEKGIGNTITLKQLELAYPDQYEYDVRETDKEYEVFLKIRL